MAGMGNVTCVVNMIINHAIYINNLYSFKPVCFFLHSAGLSHATDGGVSTVASLPQSCSSPPSVILYPKFFVISSSCRVELQANEGLQRFHNILVESAVTFKTLCLTHGK